MRAPVREITGRRHGEYVSCFCSVFLTVTKFLMLYTVRSIVGNYRYRLWCFSALETSTGTLGLKENWRVDLVEQPLSDERAQFNDFINRSNLGYDIQAPHIRRSCIQAYTILKVKDHVGETDHIRNQPGVIEIRDMYGVRIRRGHPLHACQQSASGEESERLIDL